MRTMRCVVADTVGEPSDVLHLQTRPIPEPGPGQVRIRVAAVPVHASDLHTIRGRYGFTPEFPTVPGIESVGVIDEVGSGTDGLSVGQRVITIGVKGTWQEYVVADGVRVLPVPAGMSNSTDAQILANPLTAFILTGDELNVGQVNGSCRPRPVPPWASRSSNSGHTAASRPSTWSGVDPLSRTSLRWGGPR